MKKSSNYASAGIGATLFLVAGMAAEAQQPPAPMVEIIGCNYVNGGDMDDLLTATAGWNDWADDNGVTDYTAAIMTPVLHGDSLTYDVLWLGGYETGTAFGAGTANWLTNGAEPRADFNEVVDCSQHTVFAEAILRQPEGPPPDDGGMVAFSNCSLHQGRNIGEGLAAGGRWAEYVGQNGPDIFMGQLYPFAGENPDAEYTFKAIYGYESAEVLGQFLDMLTGNGYAGANAQFGIMNPYVSCDSPRVYAIDFVRFPAGE